MTPNLTPGSTKAQKLARKTLAREANRIREISGADLLRNPGRFAANHQHVLGILFDWSNQRIDSDSMTALESLAEAWNLDEFLQAVSRGAKVNSSEGRSALHMALREPRVESSQNEPQFVQDRCEFLDFADSVRDGAVRGFNGNAFTDVVHIGIGGSHLGPALVCDALTADNRLSVHFCSNADRRVLNELLAKLDPARTLFIVASKSYATHETLENARFVKDWMYERVDSNADIAQHFVHITSKQDLNVGMERVLRISRSIGGRFSLWSAMGLPIALYLGSKRFLDLLKGAHEMDRHVLGSSLSNNVAVRSALLGLWNANYLGATSHLVLPYDSRLKLLPAYCQQLEMESNGKSVGSDNQPVDYNTSPVVWGGLETDGQHAWHQFLHQGTQNYSADIVASLDALPASTNLESHQWILANAVGQSSVMLKGNNANSVEAHQVIPGNHGSTLIFLDKLDAHTLGSLLAMYEHKVAYLGHLWGVNSFDQWGVEEGKRVSGILASSLRGENTEDVDESTIQLLRTIRARFKTR
ncbi:MAG: glucose-6-phosphate isomerase [Gammaproteobacteria bacterium]|nr:glucose-6-phosphate isomerase [Gammaproteobacteria bacterium]